MSSPYPPGPEGCTDIVWQQDDQYVTFIAPDQATYDAELASKVASLALQDREIEGDPHNCPKVGNNPDMYVARTVAVG